MGSGGAAGSGASPVPGRVSAPERVSALPVAPPRPRHPGSSRSVQPPPPRAKWLAVRRSMQKDAGAAAGHRTDGRRYGGRRQLHGRGQHCRGFRGASSRRPLGLSSLQGGRPLGRHALLQQLPLDPGQHPAPVRCARGLGANRGRRGIFQRRQVHEGARPLGDIVEPLLDPRRGGKGRQQVLLGFRGDPQPATVGGNQDHRVSRGESHDVDLLFAAQPGATDRPAESAEARPQARRLVTSQRHPGNRTADQGVSPLAPQPAQAERCNLHVQPDGEQHGGDVHAQPRDQQPGGYQPDAQQSAHVRSAKHRHHPGQQQQPRYRQDPTGRPHQRDRRDRDDVLGHRLRPSR